MKRLDRNLNLFGLVILLLFSSYIRAAVWDTDQSLIWNNEEEKRYSSWVKDNWKADVFINPESSYFGIPTDCADAAYAMRIIYSFERKLEFKILTKRFKKKVYDSIQNRYIKTKGTFITNNMNRWDYDQDRIREKYYPDYKNIEIPNSRIEQADAVIMKYLMELHTLGYEYYSKDLKEVKNYLQSINKSIEIPIKILNKSKQVITDYENEEREDRYSDYLIQKKHWSSLDEPKKKLWLFLQFVFQVTSTWSWPNDTIATPLTIEGVVPGKIILERRQHTMEIVNVSEYGIITTLASNLPIEVRELSKKASFEIESRYPYEEGILSFRWPSEYGRVTKNPVIPAFLLERNSPVQYIEWRKSEKKYVSKLRKELNEFKQNGVENASEIFVKDRIEKISSSLYYYDEYLSSSSYRYRNNLEGGSDEEGAMMVLDTQTKRLFEKKVTYLIAKLKETDTDKLNRLLQIVCDYSRSRVAAILDGIKYSKKVNRCMNKEEYHNYSTPTRDSKMREYFSGLSAFVNELKRDKSLDEVSDQKLVEYIQNILAGPPQSNVEITINPSRRVQYFEYQVDFISEDRAIEYGKSFKGYGSDRYINDVFLLDSAFENTCPVDIDGKGRVLDLRQIYNRMTRLWMSSNPTASFDARWGEDPMFTPKCKIFYD